MDQNRVSGAARNFGGKLQEEAGRATGDAETELTGKLNQAAGAAQNLYGQTMDSVRDTTGGLNEWFRSNIQTQPYTTALVVFGIGWLLGRMRQPY